jgi:tetratricopeptide (TPR) repeat protein
MIALTPDALWIQDTWQVRPVPLPGLAIEKRRQGKELALTVGPGSAAEKLTLAFASAAEGERWCREIQAQQQQPAADVRPGDRHQPEGVALVRQAPAVPYVVLGQVEFTGQTPWAADRGLQLRAGIRGADAIIEVQRQRCREIGWSARSVSGLAVRVEDADARKRLRLKWYAEEVNALVNRLLLLLGIQVVLLFLASMVATSVPGLQAPTGETPAEALTAVSLGLGLLYTWPLVLLALLRVLRWPQLLRATGLAALIATTGRGLTVWLAHLLALGATGATPAESKIWVLMDPIDWAVVIAGVVLCLRAWRLADNARQILPRDVQVDSTARRAWSGSLLAATGVYALAILSLVGIARYQDSTYLLQPGVDPRRESEALLALNEGADQANKGDLAAAEQSLQRALRLWEGLTARRPAPSAYRANLAMTLNDLGWLRRRQGRGAEAEQYYARAVALADELAGDPQLDNDFKQTLAGARQTLANLRSGQSAQRLDEQERAADRKYEEAQVKAAQGDATAEHLYREVIAVWEELLPLATNEEYRRYAVSRLATVYLELAELQQQLGQRSAAESSLQKGIDYGEKAVALEPDRPLPKHNLEVARRRLDGLRERALQEEINQLCGAERFAAAIELCVRSVEGQENQVRSGTDRAAAERRLAYRLDRLAWLLAHCPDERVRDTKAAVKHAGRATQLQPGVGDYWYTLAMIQYRNGDWQDSLASLEKVKAQEGGFDASAWFLVAMNRHQLKQKPEARSALRKGVEWVVEQQRKAEENALLRFQFEMIRPSIEALRREAEALIEGKDPTSDRVG